MLCAGALQARGITGKHSAEVWVPSECYGSWCIRQEGATGQFASCIQFLLCDLFRFCRLPYASLCASQVKTLADFAARRMLKLMFPEEDVPKEVFTPKPIADLTVDDKEAWPVADE